MYLTNNNNNDKINKQTNINKPFSNRFHHFSCLARCWGGERRYLPLLFTKGTRQKKVWKIPHLGLTPPLQVKMWKIFDFF